jgi:hypothetical protein
LVVNSGALQLSTTAPAADTTLRRVDAGTGALLATGDRAILSDGAVNPVELTIVAFLPAEA